MRWLWIMLAVLFVLTCLDHWTTYTVLTMPAPGWEVREGNPWAAWMFETFGLVPGLLIDGVLTIAIVAFIVWVRWLPRAVKLIAFAGVNLITLFAVVNNVICIRTISGG